MCTSACFPQGENHITMTDSKKNEYIHNVYVPPRIWEKEGNSITQRLTEMKQTLGENLVSAVLFPNVGFVNYGMGHSLTGVVYFLKKGTPAKDLAPYIGQLYQHITVFDVGNIKEEEIQTIRGKFRDIFQNNSGSGIPGIEEEDHSDIIDDYMQKTKKESNWNVSLGTEYPSLTGLYKSPNGQTKLYILGGHEQVHKSLLTAIGTIPDLKVEDLCDKKFALDSESPLAKKISVAKDIQKTNHSVIISRVLALLSGKQVPQEKCKNFSPPVALTSSCFVNTVQETKLKNFPGTFYAVCQGVANVHEDLSIFDKQSAHVEFFIAESPLRIHSLQINKKRLDSNLRFLPVTTGCSDNADLQMSEEDKKKLKENLQWTGHLGMHNACSLNYQPYDDEFKLYANDLFAGKASAVIHKEQTLEGQIYVVSGLDPRTLKIEDCLENTSHLQDSDMITAPATSEPVQLIFNTYPRALSIMKKNNAKSMELFHVLKTDTEKHHFAKFPIGALRLAHQLSKNERPARDLDSLQSRPKNKQNV
jgi:hypothetical protein